jgi:hypothetical protein
MSSASERGGCANTRLSNADNDRDGQVSRARTFLNAPRSLVRFGIGWTIRALAVAGVIVTTMASGCDSSSAGTSGTPPCDPPVCKIECQAGTMSCLKDRCYCDVELACEGTNCTPVCKEDPCQCPDDRPVLCLYATHPLCTKPSNDSCGGFCVACEAGLHCDTTKYAIGECVAD